MKHRRTQRRKSHSKRKTSRRVHRRRTYKRGGVNVDNFQAEFTEIKNRVDTMEIKNYEGIHNDIRNLYDRVDAAAKELYKLAREINTYEIDVLRVKTNELHGLYKNTR